MTPNAPASLAARIEASAQASAQWQGTVTFVGGDDAASVPWIQLHDEARAAAAGLRRRGFGPGSHVAILGPTTRALVTAIQATWLIGATAVLLPLPMRLGSLDEFVAQTRARIAHADIDLVLVDNDLAPFLAAEPGDPPSRTLNEVMPGAAGVPSGDSLDPPAFDPATLAILQFTSGSTSEPKGVMLPHAQVCANLDAIRIGCGLVPGEDVAVSWLPLYHDMGLIGMLTTPMTTGTDLVLAAPQHFLAAPARWMEWLSMYGGTHTAGPNFSYALAARALARTSGLDLSRWRVALNGAEPIDPNSVESFVAAGAPHKLRPGAVFCAFGMAEATLAVTFPEPLAGLTTDTVDRAVLEHEGFAQQLVVGTDRARRFAKLGRPVEGLEIRIKDTDGALLRDREVGQLQVRGSSITPGYYRRDDATAAAFDGEWLHTGDLAYQVDGELVVCGRAKDVIILGGRNVFPEDVERAASAAIGVRPGNVIAFGVDSRKGREAIVVVAETKDSEIETVRADVSRRVREAVGFAPEHVVLVGAGTIPKTSSGKLQRSLCKTRYLDDSFT